MDFGDIIYYILVVFFLILGFFNKSKKEKQAQQQTENPSFPRPDLSEHETETNKDDGFPFPKKFRNKNTLPPIPDKVPQTYQSREFQSSLSLVTDFKRESSLEGSLYLNDEGTRAIFSEQKEAEKVYPTHPLVVDLFEKDTGEELKKALIYSEIFQPKF